NKKIIKELKGHDKKVTSIAVQSAFGILFSGSMDNKTILWDLGTLTKKKEFNDHHDAVLATAIDHTTGMIASCGLDGWLYVYTKEGNPLFSQKLGNEWLWSLAFANEGKTLAVGGNRNLFIVEDLGGGQPRVGNVALKSNLLCMDFSP